MKNDKASSYTLYYKVVCPKYFYTIFSDKTKYDILFTLKSRNNYQRK